MPLLNQEQIMEIIPHRYEMLLVDEVLEIEEKTITAKLYCKEDKWFFRGHFPDYAVMPGVLQVEALAQTCAINVLNNEESKGKIGFFAKIDSCKFKNQVLPGDELILKVEITRSSSALVKAVGQTFVNDKLCTTAEITLALGKN